MTSFSYIAACILYFRRHTGGGGNTANIDCWEKQLQNFDGKICEWPEFWDGVSSSIDNNDKLSDVDKFAYLRGFLEGPAKSTIAGLSLTEANYKCSVELLKFLVQKSVREESHGTASAYQPTPSTTSSLQRARHDKNAEIV